MIQLEDSLENPGKAVRILRLLEIKARWHKKIGEDPGMTCQQVADIMSQLRANPTTSFDLARQERHILASTSHYNMLYVSELLNTVKHPILCIETWASF